MKVSLVILCKIIKLEDDVVDMLILSGEERAVGGNLITVQGEWEEFVHRNSRSKIKYNSMKCKAVCLGNNIENLRYNHEAAEEPEFLGFAKENQKRW